METIKPGCDQLTLNRNQALIKPTYHSPLQQDKGRKCCTKHIGQGKDREFASQSIPSSQAQLHSKLFYTLIPLSGTEGLRRKVVINS